jgi:hypothetical protein
MIEYLIRPVDVDGIPVETDPYRTVSIPCEGLDRPHPAIAVEGCEISFSYEDAGIQRARVVQISW